jgi:hypothetical protein
VLAIEVANIKEEEEAAEDETLSPKSEKDISNNCVKEEIDNSATAETECFPAAKRQKRSTGKKDIIPNMLVQVVVKAPDTSDDEDENYRVRPWSMVFGGNIY